MKTKLYLAAAALLGLVACQRESVDPVNPNFNKETNEVVTNFVFNVSTSSNATKQSSAAVQADPANDDFRGISNATLLTYELASDGKTLPADADANKVYNLASVAGHNTLDATNSRRVLEMSLPIHTNTLLFYGKAPKGDAYSGYKVNDCYGHMDAFSVEKTSGSADFKIGSRLADNATYVKFTTVENMFAGIETLLLNHIVPEGTVISADDYPSDLTTVYGFDVTVPAGGVRWKDYIDPSGYSPIETTEDRYPLEEKLSYLYKRVTTIRAASPYNEVRDGSGPATLYMAKDLLSVLNDIRRAEPISPAEAVAKYFANEVWSRMTTNYFAVTTTSEGQIIESVNFKENTTIAAAFMTEQATAYKPDTQPSGFYWPTEAQMQEAKDYHPAQFPLEFNIPLGASYIVFDETTQCFYYPQTFNVSAMGMPTGEYNAKNYFYPAELMYFGNSPVRVTNVDKKVSDYPNGSGAETDHWENDASWSSDWSVGQVGVSTRAVAMRDDIQYGTALLASQVQFASGVTTMNDNNHAIQKLWNPTLTDSEELDQVITVTDNSFLVTGYVIGGQPKAVDWDYLPKPGTTYGFVYDRAIPSAAQKINSATPNYTLVLDNFAAASKDATTGIYTPDTQSKVYVAIEFKNNTGKDFYGNASLIRKDSYFYLVGCLNPTEASNYSSLAWPADHAVPPYNADGSSQEVKRVFIQDYMTTAVFKLGENSLKSAYLTVPDLRSSTMSLGLSVDLNWETGLSFEDVLL